MSGANQFFSILMDAAVLPGTFPCPSVAVKYNQLYSEMRNVRALFMMLPRECFVLYCKTVEHRSRKSRDLLQTREFTSGDKVTHFCFCRDSFQCSCMRTVARLFLRVSSISAHAQGGIILLDVVSQNVPSWHGLCLTCMVIASAATLLLC